MDDDPHLLADGSDIQARERPVIEQDRARGQVQQRAEDALAPLDKCGAPDASICHGASGFAHIYNVALQWTGDEQMRHQALRWLREVLRMRRREGGIAGYLSLDVSGGRPESREDSTLLTGAAGTALVLAAAIDDHEPTWQQLFLM